MNEHSKGIDYFRKRNSVEMCCVNKPPRPVGPGRRLSGGSAATLHTQIKIKIKMKICWHTSRVRKLSHRH